MKKTPLLGITLKIAISTLIAAIPCMEMHALTPRQADSLYRAYAGNSLEYPVSEGNIPVLTPTPEGYTPWHMEHYGRHGSRWLIGKDDYAIPVRQLEKAERANKLTETGKKTLAILRDIQKAARNRWGELSDKGAVQHRGIGRRMALNFPEIFTSGANVDARSTVVIRCILSMLNGIGGIEEMAKGLNIHTDASEADMAYMNHNDRDAWKVKDCADSIYANPYRNLHQPTGEYLTRLVTDEAFARDSVAPGLMPRLYMVLANAQSHTHQPWIVPEVFSLEEAREAWLCANAGWVIHCANTPMTAGRMPYVQRNLLRNIIESADTALLSATPSANLRYGHDGIVVSLVTLMNLDGFGNEYATIDEAIESGLQTNRMCPMGGNVQIVFYRPDNKHDDWLVKVLLNEREVSLPLHAVTGPYYSWPEVRRLYLDKLGKFQENQNAGHVLGNLK